MFACKDNNVCPISYLCNKLKYTNLLAKSENEIINKLVLDSD